MRFNGRLDSLTIIAFVRDDRLRFREPDLSAAAIASAGVRDMRRCHKFTASRYGVDDYGSAEDPEKFEAIYAYSPYHNVRPGTEYPAVLVTTTDTDDRQADQRLRRPLGLPGGESRHTGPGALRREIYPTQALSFQRWTVHQRLARQLHPQLRFGFLHQEPRRVAQRVRAAVDDAEAVTAQILFGAVRPEAPVAGIQLTAQQEARPLHAGNGVAQLRRELSQPLHELLAARADGMLSRTAGVILCSTVTATSIARGLLVIVLPYTPCRYNVAARPCSASTDSGYCPAFSAFE